MPSQMQLREEENKRLEAHAAWEARQAEEEAQARVNGGAHLLGGRERGRFLEVYLRYIM